MTQRGAPRHFGQPETWLSVTKPLDGKQHPGNIRTNGTDLIGQRVDDFEQRIADFDFIACGTQECHHARMRRIEQFGTFEWQTFTGLMCGLRPVTADKTLFGQKRQNAFGVRLRLRLAGVGLTTQLDSGRQTRQRDLRLREGP